MKRKRLLVLGLLCSCLLAGCKKDSSQLMAGDLEKNTFLIDKDGAVQAATVETFDQPNYDAKELEAYLRSVIEEYNNKAGKGSVEMSSFQVENEMAGSVFSYRNIEDYQSLNEVEAELLSLDNAKEYLDLSFKSLDGTEKTAEDILADSEASKIKVLVLNEEYDVIVEGTVKYYANAALLNNQSVHTDAEEASVILYK